MDGIDIRFRPVSKVKRSVNGRRVLIFDTPFTYDGIQYPDKTVSAYSERYGKYFKLGINDYMINWDA